MHSATQQLAYLYCCLPFFNFPPSSPSLSSAQRDRASYARIFNFAFLHSRVPIYLYRRKKELSSWASSRGSRALSESSVKLAMCVHTSVLCNIMCARKFAVQYARSYVFGCWNRKVVVSDGMQVPVEVKFSFTGGWLFVC